MHSHKTVRLCHQVEEAIACALAGSADPVLRDLYVVGVQPVRGVCLLRVLLSGAADAPGVAETLARANGYLRGEVAGAIHRKRVPALELVVIPPEPSGD